MVLYVYQLSKLLLQIGFCPERLERFTTEIRYHRPGEASIGISLRDFKMLIINSLRLSNSVLALPLRYLLVRVV